MINTIAKILKEAEISKGETGSLDGSVREKCSISRTRFSQIKHNKRQPNTRELKSIYECLKVYLPSLQMDDLLKEEELI
jgi:hypothetical protein